MSKHRAVPIPFLILILAGVVSLFSIAADRNSRTRAVRNDPLQMRGRAGPGVAIRGDTEE